MLTTIQKYGITLAVFTTILTSITALVHELTKDIINKQIIQQQQELFKQVIPATFYDNDLQKSCLLVNAPQLGQGMHRIFIAHKNNSPVGVVMEAIAPDGYSGAINLLIATDFKGTVLGTRVIEHHETPGLGDKIEINSSDWILRFAGKIIHSDNDTAFAIKKNGGEFDQFTGATITPRAVVNAVKRAGLYAKTLPTQLHTLPACKRQV